MPDKDCVVWNLKNFAGQQEINLLLHFLVPTLREDNAVNLTKPISVNFDIPSFTVSGIQVKYLKITERSGYQAFPYVKYITVNGDYHIRMI